MTVVVRGGSLAGLTAALTELSGTREPIHPSSASPSVIGRGTSTTTNQRRPTPERVVRKLAEGDGVPRAGHRSVGAVLGRAWGRSPGPVWAPCAVESDGPRRATTPASTCAYLGRETRSGRRLGPEGVAPGLPLVAESDQSSDAPALVRMASGSMTVMLRPVAVIQPSARRAARALTTASRDRPVHPPSSDWDSGAATLTRPPSGWP